MKDLLPPQYVHIRSDVIYDLDLPDPLYRSYARLVGLAWKDKMGRHRVEYQCLGSSTATHFPLTGFDLFIDLFDQGYFMAHASHYPQVVYPLSFVILFGAHAPSLPEIPEIRYLQARNIGIIPLCRTNEKRLGWSLSLSSSCWQWC